MTKIPRIHIQFWEFDETQGEIRTPGAVVPRIELVLEFKVGTVSQGSIALFHRFPEGNRLPEDLQGGGVST